MELNRHLDWENRKKTCFVSVYGQKEAAERCAQNRVAWGKTNVRLYSIDLRRTRKSVTFRLVPKLADTLRYEIEGFVGNNADHEFLVWNGLPAETCVRVKKYC